MAKYYDGTKLLSMLDINGNKPEIYMCTTNRTGGKTTYFGRLCINRFLDKGEKFGLIYRYNYELDDIVDKFYKDLGSLFFPSHTMTSKRRASGMYWNYFYHTWKTVSNSPFANACVFVTDDATITLPTTITAHVDAKDESDTATVFTISPDLDGQSLKPHNVNFIQTEELTKAGIAVQRYGGVMIPNSQVATEITLVAEINGTKYTAIATITGATTVGTDITLNKG